jgi:arsenate reductase (glutaredoxin)
MGCGPVKRPSLRYSDGRELAPILITRMQKVTIWHNPGCSKSRKILELLQSRHMEIQVVEYLKTPPEPAAIEHTLTLLRMQPRELMRTSEDEYRSRHLDDPGLTRRQLIDAMCAYPILIQRPIVFANGNACIGRPPEAVLAIL